jgi:hypothetical protein
MTNFRAAEAKHADGDAGPAKGTLFYHHRSPEKALG